MHLSQNWGSDGHFEVLNRSKIWLVQKFVDFFQTSHYLNIALSEFALRTEVRGNFNIHGTKIFWDAVFHDKSKIYDVLSILNLWLRFLRPFLQKKKKIEKKIWKKKNYFLFFYFFPIFKSPASGKENVRFPDSPDFDNLPDFQTGRDVRLSPTRVSTLY